MGSVKRTTRYDLDISGSARIYSLTFMESPPPGVPLLFRVSGDPCTPEVALDIEELDTSAYNAGTTTVMRETLSGAKIYPIKSPHFKLTDYAINGIPAYWKHKMKYPVWRDAIGRRRVSVTDVSGKVVDNNRWNYDPEQNTLYLLFTNVTDSPSGHHIYYVSYIRGDETNNVVDQAHRELLDPEYVCHEITPLDTNCLNQARFGSHAYSVDVNSDVYKGTSVVIYLPSTRTHYIEYTRPRKIQLTKPRAQDLKMPWYCIVKGSTSFKARHGYEGSINSVIRYTLKEYLFQNYYPWYPIMPSGIVSAKYIAPGIYTVKPPALVVTNTTPLTVIVSKGNTVVKAYASHSMPTQHFKGVKWDIGNIQCDRLRGIVVVPDEWSEDYDVTCSFFHEEDGVPYTHKDFNPHTDPDVLKQATLIYMRPESESTDRTVFHIVFDRNLNVWDSPTRSYISNDPVMHEENTYTAQPRLSNDIVRSITNYDTSKYSNGLEAFLAQNPDILTLGLVRVGTGVGMCNVELVDARSPGGGIDPEKIDDAFLRTDAVLFANDVGGASGIMDGGRNCIVIKVKQSVIDAGYTTDDIEAIVSKYTEPGVKVICQVVGDDGW